MTDKLKITLCIFKCCSLFRMRVLVIVHPAGANPLTSTIFACATRASPNRTCCCCFRLNDAAADEQRKHDAATSQLRAEAAAREAALQERSRQAAELAQQLEAAGAALAEQQRKAESFRQLQQTSAQQLEALRHTHTVSGVVWARHQMFVCWDG